MITGPLPPTKPVKCLECSITAAAVNAVQLHNKRGPAYDRWAKAMAKVTAGLNTQRLG